tara:strand:- start:32 stop:601 length:570 start_codon:yes stop_codon:yes gene_type:complete
MAPINNQGDGEVYTQYRQWPYNSTNMGSNKERSTNGNAPNAYPGHEEEERKRHPMAMEYESGNVYDFKDSQSKTGMFLVKNKEFIWPKELIERVKDMYSHGYLAYGWEDENKRKIESYKPIRIYRQGNKVMLERFPWGKRKLDSDEIALLKNEFVGFDIVDKLNLSKPKSFIDTMYPDMIHPGDEEEKA